MDKGIRPYARNCFLQNLPQRSGSTDRKVNTQFRKTITSDLMEQFGISLASAATHYNDAFKNARELAKTDATLAAHLVGLGRPEDKKGGRKKKVQGPAAETTETTEQTEQTPAAPAEPLPDAAEHAALLYSVFRKKDDELVAKDLTRDQADELINKARAAKKAALYLESQSAE